MSDSSFLTVLIVLSGLVGMFAVSIGHISAFLTSAFGAF